MSKRGALRGAQGESRAMDEVDDMDDMDESHDIVLTQSCAVVH